MGTRWRLAKNAIANLLRGGAASIVALVLPAVLVRHMSQIEYSVWILVLQVAAYCSYLEFGLQTAVGRYIAVSHERRDDEQRDAIYTTAFAGLTVAACVAITLILGVALASNRLFPRVPAALLPQMRWSLVIVGASMALGLPSSAWVGIFIGLQRNEFIALVNGGSKLISALALVVAVVHGASLVGMAATMAVVNLISYILLYVLLRSISRAQLRFELISRTVTRELFNYCSSLMVWSFSMLLVTGFDLILVGRFQVDALGPYAIAATVVTFIAGIQNAIFGAVMPQAAVLHARRDAAALGSAVISGTRFGLLLLLLTGLPLIVWASPILRLWVGPQYAIQGRLLLAVLVIANMVRLAGLPYATILVASGQQRLVTLSPLIEGFSNLISSIALGMKFGAIGVAAGTLIGSAFSILVHIAYNMPRTRGEIALRSLDFVLSGLLPPLCATLPLAAVAVYAWSGSSPSLAVFAAALVSSLAFAAVLLMQAPGMGYADYKSWRLSNIFWR